MKTLIEFFDSVPFYNLLSPDVFKPETVVFLCPAEIAQDKSRHERMRSFFTKRNEAVQLVFIESSRYHTGKIAAQLRKVIEEYEDCAVDIFGGSDAMLFAAGIVAATSSVPVFTYSIKKNKYFNISNADFVEGVECTSIFSIDDYIYITGGRAESGRARNDSLDSHMKYIEPLFSVFFRNRLKWSSIVSWIQHASKNSNLHVRNAQLSQKCERRVINCPESVLKELSDAGLLLNLKISDTVSFDFPDSQIRFWLRDVGSALEVFTYKKVLDYGTSTDCRCSVIIRWDANEGHDSVYNEVDVMAVFGLAPCFVSCKTCRIDTDALNELNILRRRFGAHASTAAIVSTEACPPAIRNRAHALDIDVIDVNDIRKLLQHK